VDETEPTTGETPEPPPLPEILPEGAAFDRVPELGSAAKVGIFLCVGGLLGVLLWVGEGWEKLTPLKKVAGFVEVAYASTLGLGIFRIRAKPLLDRAFNRAMVPIAIQAGLLFLGAGLLTLSTKGRALDAAGGIMAMLLVTSRYLGPIFAIPAALRGRRTALLWVAEGLGLFALLTLLIMYS